MLHFLQGIEPPYITNKISGIGGRLRAAPEHFVVEEIPLYEPADEGQHLYVRLTKSGLTTKEVERRLLRLFDLPRGAVGFAGMKDKHATTTQTFSLNVGYQAETFADEAMARIMDSLPVQVEWARFHRNKLKAGHLLGNRFKIVISQIPLAQATALEQSQAIVEQLIAHGVPNYFGSQRFGIDGRNVARGLDVLRGQEYVKDKWLRRFLISAYQSFLCNHYLGARVRQEMFLHLLDGDVAKKYATGGLFIVDDVEIEQTRYAACEISFTAPLYGAKMKPAERVAGALEAQILTEAEVDPAQFAKARIDGSRRLGRLLLQDIAVSNAAIDDASESEDSEYEDGSRLTVEFTLPKGAFATVVLRELMKTELPNLPEIDER